MEVSDRGESESNSKCEQAVQVVAEFLRVLKGSLSSGARSRLCAVTLSHWMVRWAAMLLSKYEMGLDGRTPHERTGAPVQHGRFAV